MHAESFCRKLTEVLEMTAEEDRLETLAKELAAFFKVEDHEVGLFKLDSMEKFATFVWPRSRASHNINIPVKGFFTSLLSATARKSGGNIDNTFASSPHLKMFEHTLSDRAHCIPLQKVIAAPASDGENLRWIVQISRKGKTLAEAGPDFTESDLEDLVKIACHLATMPLRIC